MGSFLFKRWLDENLLALSLRKGNAIKIIVRVQ